jgi:hypothetical protein
MSKRFEVSILPDRRAALDALARELGCSTSDLARLGVTWVLRNRDAWLAVHPCWRHPCWRGSLTSA